MLVVFDWDGVAVKTIKGLLDAYKQAVEETVPQANASKERAVYDKLKGYPIEEIAEDRFGNKKGMQVIKRYRELAHKVEMGNKAVAAFRKAVKQLRSEGHTVAVSTSSPHSYIWNRVEAAGLGDLFEKELVVGYANGFAKGKAHIEHLKQKTGESYAVMFDDGLAAVLKLRDARIRDFQAFHFDKKGDVKNYGEIPNKVRETAGGIGRR